MTGTTRRLNICFVGTPWLAVGPARGGIEKILWELSRIMSQAHEVHIVCPAPREDRTRPVKSEVVFHYAPISELRDYPVRDRLDFTKEGVMLAVRLFFAIVGMAAFFVALHRKHEFDVTFISNKYVAAPILWGRRRGGPGIFIYSEQNTWPWLHPTPPRGSARLRHRVNVFLGRHVCQLSDLVQVNSESLRDAMAANGIDSKRLVPIANGSEIPAQESATPSLSEPIRVGFVGRLAEEKGIRILVDTIRAVNAARPEIRFDIFGDGPLRSLVLQSGLRNFTLWGERPRDEVLDALRLIHIILFLSPVENIPSVALMEALALGKAIVATSVGDTPRFLTDGRNALLCNPDPAEVAKAIATLCHIPGLYETVTRGARALAASYSWEEIARRHLDMYLSLLTSGAT